MRTELPRKLQAARVVNHVGPNGGLNGRFILKGPSGSELQLISSDGKQTGWETVSVWTDGRCPDWTEMCFAKDLFWDDEEAVMQLHPPRSQYVNNDRYCLHLWKPIRKAIPLPPARLVGFVGLGPDEAEHMVHHWASGQIAKLGTTHAA